MFKSAFNLPVVVKMFYQGGKITVASEVNKGSAFNIEFEEIGS